MGRRRGGRGGFQNWAKITGMKTKELERYLGDSSWGLDKEQRNEKEGKMKEEAQGVPSPLPPARVLWELTEYRGHWHSTLHCWSLENEYYLPVDLHQ